MDTTATGVRPGRDIGFAFSIPNFGDFADPRVFARCVKAAEEAGWDAVLTWDALVGEKRRPNTVADPWILLAAAGMITDRIRLGTEVTPLPRRRVRKLAKELTTLDVLTGGRMILGAGSGDPISDEYAPFGEPTDRVTLAAILDESLDALALIQTGDTVDYHGTHVTIDHIAFPFTPVQRPRIPVWIGGNWKSPAVMRRIARWDGAVPFASAAPRSVRSWRHKITELRDGDTRFDLVLGGSTDPAAATDLVGPLAEAGTTWWEERMPLDNRLLSAAATTARIEQGPPRLNHAAA